MIPLDGCCACVPRLHLTIINRSGSRVRYDRARLQGILDAALIESVHEGTACSLNVLLVNDQESARLHDDHFNDPSPTDVMTFPDGSLDPATGRLHLGDLAVGVQVAAREAHARDRRHGEELTLYILHGLLHLLGYDDVTPAKRKRMWAAQHRLLAAAQIQIETAPC